jgi:prephenate dehydrogenase
MIIFKKIAIVGVGLIGGSIGLAIRTRRLSLKVIGIGRRKASLDRAIQKSAIDKATLEMEEGIKDADLVIIATPVNTVREKILEAAGYAKPGSVIIDVNSTKQNIVGISQKLPEGVYFIGTHPMAGSEKSGILSSSPELFDNTICIITPTAGTDKKVLEKIRMFWESLGARVCFMSPKAHDVMVAKASHLPHILAYALCNTLSEKELNVTGSGFKDVTRIAKSSPQMWEEIFIGNKSSVLKAIALFEKNLDILKYDIAKNKRLSLRRRLKNAMEKRQIIG